MSCQIFTDRETVESYRRKPLGWRQHVKENTKIADVLSYGPNEAIVYAQYHMTGRFVILRRIFKEIKMVMPSFVPERVFDFGCGPGTAATAAVDVWKVRTIDSISSAHSSFLFMRLHHTHALVHNK